jgi:hypothetical protein
VLCEAGDELTALAASSVLPPVLGVNTKSGFYQFADIISSVQTPRSPSFTMTFDSAALVEVASEPATTYWSESSQLAIFTCAIGVQELEEAPLVVGSLAQSMRAWTSLSVSHLSDAEGCGGHGSGRVLHLSGYNSVRKKPLLTHPTAQLSFSWYKDCSCTVRLTQAPNSVSDETGLVETEFQKLSILRTLTRTQFVLILPPHSVIPRDLSVLTALLRLVSYF